MYRELADRYGSKKTKRYVENMPRLLRKELIPDEE
jgi:hypothetical protein